MRSPTRFVPREHAAFVVSLVFGAACGGEDATVVGTAILGNTPDVSVTPPADETPAPDVSAPEAPEVEAVGGTGPVYALMTQVYDADDRNVYVLVTNTLDPSDVSLRGAREYPGVANLEAVGGRLMISSGEAPIITSFEIGDDLAWTEVGQISFQAYGLSDANFFGHFVIDEHTTYLPFERTKRILWNPADLEITGVREDSNVPLTRNGLLLDGGGNRNSVVYDGAVMRSFFYHDDLWYDFGPDSLIAKYDPVTHEETDVLTAPCPGLDIATRDKDGYTYFSTWDYSPARALYGVGPKPCVVRVTPELQLDAAFTTDFTSWTDGRYVMNFRYIGDGKAIGNVLHHEETGIDFSAPYDALAVETLWESGPLWRLWLFDVETETAQPIEGIDADISSGGQFAVLDGRTFLFLPIDDWARTRVYELDADGRARFHFEIEGDVFKWVRVR